MAEQQTVGNGRTKLPRVEREQLEELMIGPFGIRAVQTKGVFFPKLSVISVPVFSVMWIELRIARHFAA